MKALTTITKILGALAVLAFAAPSNADLVYVLDLDVTSTDDGGTATVTFTNFSNGDGDSISFDIVIENTSSVNGALTSLAWLMPAGTDSMSLDGQAITAGSDGNIAFSLNFGTNSLSPLTDNFDACLISGANCVGGNVSDGIATGSTGTLNITANMGSDTTAADFEDLLAAAIAGGVSTNGGNPINTLGICARFQGLGAIPQQEIGGESDKKCGRGGDTPVPEPGTLALLGLGLFGLGISRRRRITA